MVRLYHSTVDGISEADIVIIGIADESKSHAKRKGTSKGPDIIRIASNDSDFFERDGKIIPICPMNGYINNKKIFDDGNIQRQDLYQLIFDLVSIKKIPIIIGGDHSITTIALQAINDSFGKVGLLYFDAHPDFVSSTTDYYGSVLTDSSNCIDYGKSLLIGTRSAELEELRNAYNVGLEVVTPIDIAEQGIGNIADRIKCRNNNGRRYISIDLDCLDPAFAPGVSVPSPCGISSIDLIYLSKLAISSGIVGLDVVEFTPDFDINNITASLAARILLESIASINTP
ncbi:MAG TPA: arginase family protein [Candidatus Sulfopaludibacter sp.]|nr:arginase family protein [Candidatus Sulfopaludibacter sp.]